MSFDPGKEGGVRVGFDPERVGVKELLYDNKMLSIIRERFPSVTVEDASDEIHEGRVWIQIPDVKVGEFYEHACRCGYAGVLFSFLLHLRSGRDVNFTEWAEALAAKLKAEEASGDAI